MHSTHIGASRTDMCSADCRLLSPRLSCLCGHLTSCQNAASASQGKSSAFSLTVPLGPAALLVYSTELLLSPDQLQILTLPWCKTLWIWASPEHGLRRHCAGYSHITLFCDNVGINLQQDSACKMLIARFCTPSHVSVPMVQQQPLNMTIHC